MKTMHGRGGFASERKWALGAKSGIETALCQRITGTDWKRVLENRRKRKKITKKAHAGRGLKTIWEIPVNTLAGRWLADLSDYGPGSGMNHPLSENQAPYRRLICPGLGRLLA
jgi:hypothetical protein